MRGSHPAHRPPDAGAPKLSQWPPGASLVAYPRWAWTSHERCCNIGGGLSQSETQCPHTRTNPVPYDNFWFSSSHITPRRAHHGTRSLLDFTCNVPRRRMQFTACRFGHLLLTGFAAARRGSRRFQRNRAQHGDRKSETGDGVRHGSSLG